MDRPPVNNAFTMLETMFVLLILTVFTWLSIPPSFSSVNLFAKRVMAYSVLTQEKAFVEKSEKEVRIETHKAVFDTIELEYPSRITCDPYTFHYNAKGNISRANTIKCYEGERTISLIFQLGSGRVRIE